MLNVSEVRSLQAQMVLAADDRSDSENRSGQWPGSV